MKLLTQHEVEKSMDKPWHHTTQGTWDGADPTPQHKAHEERFYFSC